MKWFKKLQDKRDARSNKYGTMVFGEFWNNVKGRSAVLLLIWLIFIAIILALINSNASNNNDTSEMVNESIEFPSINEYFNNKSSNYSYNISIYNISDETYTYFNGEVNDGTNIGIKKQDNKETNYLIKDNVVYNALTNKEMDNLYEDYLTEFFNLQNIYDFIKDKTPVTSTDNDIKIYEYDETYNNQSISFIIKTSINEVTYIEYTYNNYKYIINII